MPMLAPVWPLWHSCDREQLTKQHNIEDGFGFLTVRRGALWTRRARVASWSPGATPPLCPLPLQVCLLGYLGCMPCLLCQELSTVEQQALTFNGSTMGQNQQTVIVMQQPPQQSMAPPAYAGYPPAAPAAGYPPPYAPAPAAYPPQYPQQGGYPPQQGGYPPQYPPSTF